MPTVWKANQEIDLREYAVDVQNPNTDVNHSDKCPSGTLAYASGRCNGDINKVEHADRPVHDWYRFVLAFPPHLVREYTDRFALKSNNTVLDPFCGTGTTLVECKKLGIPSVGIETNPVASFASSVKVDWSIDADLLLDHACEIAKSASTELISQGISTDSLLFLNERSDSVLRTLDQEKMGLLLTNSISPLPLHKTLVLLDHLNARKNEHYRQYELLALAKALVQSISNLKFGPEVGVGRAKQDAPVVEVWLEEVRAIANDLKRMSLRKSTDSQVYRGDSRDIPGILEPNSIDAVITSPPYPNEKDYTRTTRLESVLLGFINSKSDLRSLKAKQIRSNTRSVYKNDDDDKWVADNQEVQRISEAIENRRIELGKTSGFERLYPRVTKLYFGGMARHLAELRQVLRPGAQLAYVVGDQASYLRIMIRTGQILADIAVSLGYELTSIDLFRTRLSTATREQLREEVVVLRWPGNHS